MFYRAPQTLPLLYSRFNHLYDYPVVIFHDGLAPASRARILSAEPRLRIWFSTAADFGAVPREELLDYFVLFVKTELTRIIIEFLGYEVRHDSSGNLCSRLLSLPQVYSR